MSIAILFLKYSFSSEPSSFINIIKASKNSIYFWEFILVNIQYIGIFPEKIKCNSNYNTSITKTSTQQYHVIYSNHINNILFKIIWRKWRKNVFPFLFFVSKCMIFNKNDFSILYSCIKSDFEAFMSSIWIV